MSPSPDAPLATESKVETAKRHGDHLRGTLAATLVSSRTHFDTDDVQLLKFHGSYQQDDRDRRRAREGEKAHSFMIRAVLPAGLLTAEQYLAFDRLADERANGTLRVTTRQGFQLHGVILGDLKPAIAAINAALATTLAACGDVQRNVLGCPAPIDDAPHRAVRAVARALADALRPASRAYYEIWLDEERTHTTEPEEPFYGAQYLPRKFKVAVGLASDNCLDLYANDAALEAVVEAGEVVGYNVLVGGGLGMTHGKGDTIARLADPLVFVAPADAVEAIRLVAAIFRDHGNRSDRRHARLKYLVTEWGLPRFREEFTRRAAFAVAEPRPVARAVGHDHLGVQPQGDGKLFYGLFLPSGRIADRGNRLLKQALVAIVRELRPTVTLTAHQNLLLGDLDAAGVARIDALLTEHGVPLPATLAPVVRHSLACPALPTCGLAVAESERLLPSVLDGLEGTLTALGVGDVPLTVRMTGCPNGCARPYTADLAFVGRTLDKYHVYVGGGLAGDRVVDLYRADVPTAELLPTVRPLLARWAGERRRDEGLGDFFHRVIRGGGPARRVLTGKELPLVTGVPA